MKTTIDKSRLMKRAWYLTKNKVGSFAYNLKMVWAEMKRDLLKKIELAKRELTPSFQGCNVQPTAEGMTNFYNSNVYKGD